MSVTRERLGAPELNVAMWTKVHTDILDPATKSPWYDAVHYDGVRGLADVERASLTVWEI